MKHDVMMKHEIRLPACLVDLAVSCLFVVVLSVLSLSLPRLPGFGADCCLV
jgi:hypothetical protein